MQRWTGRVAVITGTSSGIGAAIAYQLQDHGLNVVALARRAEKIENAVETARQEAKDRKRYQKTNATPGKLYVRKCDVQNEEDIVSTFKWVKDTFGRVDILVNNAGVVGEGKITETPTVEWRKILDTNVLGLSIGTREAVKLMREKGIDDGHIVHISSVAGPSPPAMGLPIVMYTASKHAVRALTEGLRKDFVEHKEKTRITSVSPGGVYTEMLTRAGEQHPAFANVPMLQSEDIADAVLFAISAPPHVQIHEIIIKPVGETYG